MDEGDYSARAEEQFNEQQLANHQARGKASPEFDATGSKICIDCGSLIPEKRAALEFVVRCIYCQEEEEKSANPRRIF